MAEAGTSTAATRGVAYQGKIAYSFTAGDYTISPYVGLRQSRLDIDSWTEVGNLFPLAASGYSVTSTDALLGMGISRQLTDRLTGSVSAGVTQNLANDAGKIAGTSDISDLFAFSSANAPGKATSVSVGAGLSYALTPNSRIGANVGWSDQTMLQPQSTSIGLGYSVGF